MRAYSKATYSSEPEKKIRQPHMPTRTHSIALNQRESTLSHIHITLLKKDSICAFRRDEYALSGPKSVTKEAYIKAVLKVKSNLIKSFKKQQIIVERVTGRAVCSVAAKRLVTKALQVRKEHAGSHSKLSEQFKACKSKKLKISGRVVTALTEPYILELTSL